jgi:hypothetical protein
MPSWSRAIGVHSRSVLLRDIELMLRDESSTAFERASHRTYASRRKRDERSGKKEAG